MCSNVENVCYTDKHINKLESNNWIKSAKLKYSLPSQLIVKIEEEKPTFILKNNINISLLNIDGKKIQDLKKYFTNLDKYENYETSLENLAESKVIIFDFFDNVMVNDKDKAIKKNRLELLNMLCKTYDNYINFSNIETL